MHSDSHRIEVDVHRQTVALRDPGEDYVLIQCVHRADSGGASLVADGYRVVDRLRGANPGLWEFLTTVDVDFYGAWSPLRGVVSTPQVCRHVEWTRAGRRVVRANQGARLVWRDLTFRLFFLGRTVSMTGTGMPAVVLPILVFQLTGSASAM